MPAQSRGGCGCCGCFFALLLVLSAGILIGLGFFIFTGTSGVNRLVVRGPFPSAVTQFNKQTYTVAREKIDRFFRDSSEPTLTLSNAELDALLADAPEVAPLGRGVLVFLNQGAADVHCSLPIGVPFLPKRYLNFSFEARPSMRGDEVVLDISKVEREGRGLSAADLQKVNAGIVPLAEYSLSNLNRFSGNGPIRNVKIENGNLVLSR